MKKLMVFFYIIHCTIIIDNCICQWQPDVRLTNDAASSTTSFNNAWCIAAVENIIHVVWTDLLDGNKEIYYKRSTDAGVSWGADTRLTNNSADSRSPSISVSGDMVHLVWSDFRDGNFEIYYKKSTNAGINWGQDARITSNSAVSENPSLAISGQSVHVIWQDFRDGNDEIYYKGSTNGGIIWGGDMRLTINTDIDEFPSISASGNVVHAVLWAYPNGKHPVYKHSMDGGASWDSAISLSADTGYSSWVSVASSGSLVHTAWNDKRDGNDEIYYRRSTNGGVSWDDEKRLTDNTAFSSYPSLAASGSFVHLVWNETRDGNNEIYYKRSTNSGVTWDADRRLTSNNDSSWYPSIAVSGTVVHVLWTDTRDGNDEIYYKRDPTGNPIGIININTEIPDKFSLSQNYPNPFNPTTNIEFSIPNSGFVNLTIYDVSGREVESLVNGDLKPGTYKADWNAIDQPSGVYFYTLRTTSFTETKRMILIK